jgi:hypothetical protein
MPPNGIRRKRQLEEDVTICDLFFKYPWGKQRQNGGKATDLKGITSLSG